MTMRRHNRLDSISLAPYVVTKNHVKSDIAMRLALDEVSTVMDGITWDAYMTLQRERKPPTSYLST